ncbi:MAG: hypothetical protein A2138_20055 [Deltaproteobacteria bacterium RBG_16_71_12]|nr:MAG: hypothetical protein A2138_20055 [Deltaproteobacteria bacterium RBG_16_71_12]
MADTLDLPILSSAAVIELIGGYAIIRQLGAGGAADVYACRDYDLGRDVAVKVLREDSLVNDVEVERFRREGRVLAKIDSPHVVRVLQVGVHNKVPYLVMELLEGKDAETTLKERGPFELTRALDVAKQVALGLATAHDAGVLHRDVKPSNILLTEGGVKLTDFGLAAPVDGSAALTQVGSIPGTAAFMPPERIRGQRDDARSDIYALGCTLYTLVAGRPPFDGEAPIAVIAAHLNDAPPRLGVRDVVADLVDEMLAKEPARRPQSAAVVAQRIATILGQGRPSGRDALLNEIEENLAPPTGPPAPALVVGDRSAVSADEPTDASVPAPPPPAVATAEARPASAAPLATGIAGSLARMGLAEVLQALEHAAATACIELRSTDGETGSVAVESGRLVYARAGHTDGRDAFFTLMRWRSGNFQVHYDRQAPKRNLDAALQAMLLEAFRRLHEGPASPPEPAPGTAAPPAPPRRSTGAAPRVDVQQLRARAIEVADACRRRAAPFVAAVRARWDQATKRQRLLAAGGAMAAGLALVVAAAWEDEPVVDENGVTVDRRVERVAAGEAREVLHEIERLPPADRRPADELLRGHALAALHDSDAALEAYSKAVKAGAVDDGVLAFLLRAINVHPADGAIEALRAWPNDDVVPRLEQLVAEGDWWERHHALVVLEQRKQADGVDITALGVRDLKTGPSCAKRRHGLTMLRDAGRGQGALRAIDEAQRRSGNNCISWLDINEARSAVSRRGQRR